jgi:hypothetical protein
MVEWEYQILIDLGSSDTTKPSNLNPPLKQRDQEGRLYRHQLLRDQGGALWVLQ